MKSTNATQQFIPSPLDNTRLAHLCGPLDENLRQISAALDVTLFRRGEKFIADGDNAAVAVAMLEKFYAKAEQAISVEEIQLALVEQKAANAPKADKPAAYADPVTDTAADSPVLKTRRTDLRGRTPQIGRAHV